MKTRLKKLARDRRQIAWDCNYFWSLFFERAMARGQRDEWSEGRAEAFGEILGSNMTKAAREELDSTLKTAVTL